ncbi:MAG TPA: hypothetical protein VKB67_06070 [Rhizomicrobium sp.]|nr:hypothetical protein [Rhizomicrobium sp.]
MRALFFCLLLSPLVLSGCDAVTRKNGDWFESSGVPPGQYDRDEQDCRIEAADYASYDLHGMSGTSYDRNRAFNNVYARCMTGRGYRPRPYSENWLPG